MTSIIICIVLIVAFVGIAAATWSIVDTRKKYFDEYVKRKVR